MRKFLIVWGGQMLSTLGSGLTSFALGVWIYEQTGSVGLLTGSFLAWLLPDILLSPVAGVLADRYNRRTLMIAGDVGAGLSSLFILAMVLFGDLQIWQIYLATAINGASTAFQWPAYAAAIPQMVEKDQLGRANGLLQAEEGISYIAAPALAAGLYVTIGLSAVILVDVLTFCIAIVTLLTITLPPPAPDEAESPNFIERLRRGAGFITAERGLIGLLVFYMAIEFFQEFTYPLIQPILLELTTPDGMGTSLSIMAGGAVVGVVVMTVWGGARRRIPWILGLTLLSGLAMALAGLRPNIVLITVGGFLFFAMTPIIEALDLAFWQTKVPTDMQGRVFSLVGAATNAVRPAALVFAGPLADGLFSDLLAQGGPLADTVVGQVVGVGPGRGVALLVIVIGACLVLTALIGFAYRPLRELEADPAIEEVVGGEAPGG